MTEATRTATWREDDNFREFAPYTIGGALDAPDSSGYSLIGAGGVIDASEFFDEGDEPDEDFEDPEVVVLYFQELDSGADMELRITPDSARSFADRLIQWADDAEGSNETADARIERLRNKHYKPRSKRGR